MNAVVILLACVAAASSTSVAYTVPGQQYYVPTSYSSQYQYVNHHQPSAVNAVKYVQPVVSGSTVQQYAVPSTQQYAVPSTQQYAVPSTQQYVYNAAVPSYYSSPVVSSYGSYGYGVGAYSPSYVYPSASYVYGK